MSEIEDRIDAINLKIESEKLRHKREMMLLRNETELVQLDCKHKWRSRSIMGRDEVTECSVCGKEYP